MEAADAPSTPTAEAKRPSRSAPAEAPVAEASTLLEAEPHPEQEEASTSANGHAGQQSAGEITEHAVLLQEPQASSSSFSQSDTVVPHDGNPQMPSSQPFNGESNGIPLAGQVAEDQAESSNKPRLFLEEHQPPTAAEAVRQPIGKQDHDALLELQRQRSLETEAHLAQVRLNIVTSPPCCSLHALVSGEARHV